MKQLNNNKSTYSSDRLASATAANAPFVVTRSMVSATMDMGVGLAGLQKLCRHLDMSCMNATTFAAHAKAVASAGEEATEAILHEAAAAVRSAYQDLRLPT